MRARPGQRVARSARRRRGTLVYAHVIDHHRNWEDVVVDRAAQPPAEGDVQGQMFAQCKVDSITNDVHAGIWTSPAMQALFDRHNTAWRLDNASLRYALGISRQ